MGKGKFTRSDAPAPTGPPHPPSHPGFHHVVFCLWEDEQGNREVNFYPDRTDPDPASCARLLRWAMEILLENPRILSHAAGDCDESDLS